MKKLKILGAGCPTCEKLADITEEVATSLGIEHELEKVTDVNEFVKFGVAVTPALVIDGEVKASGRIPDKKEIQNWLLE